MRRLRSALFAGALTLGATVGVEDAVAGPKQNEHENVDTVIDDAKVKAEASRLVGELSSKSLKNQYKAVDQIYNQLLSMSEIGYYSEPENVMFKGDMKITHFVHYEAAKAALSLGHSTDYKKRLQAAIDGSNDYGNRYHQQYVQEMDIFTYTYTPVILGEESGDVIEFAPETVPFDAQKKAVIDDAISQLASNGYYEGMLPAGKYNFGGKLLELEKDISFTTITISGPDALEKDFSQVSVGDVSNLQDDVASEVGNVISENNIVPEGFGVAVVAVDRDGSLLSSEGTGSVNVAERRPLVSGKRFSPDDYANILPDDSIPDVTSGSTRLGVENDIITGEPDSDFSAFFGTSAPVKTADPNVSPSLVVQPNTNQTRPSLDTRESDSDCPELADIGRYTGCGVFENRIMQYSGDFMLGAFHGEGTLTSKDKDTGHELYRYVGEFNQYLFDGHGIFSDLQSGILINGTWKAGTPISADLFVDDVEGALQVVFTNGVGHCMIDGRACMVTWDKMTRSLTLCDMNSGITSPNDAFDLGEKVVFPVLSQKEEHPTPEPETEVLDMSESDEVESVNDDVTRKLLASVKVAEAYNTLVDAIIDAKNSENWSEVESLYHDILTIQSSGINEYVDGQNIVFQADFQIDSRVYFAAALAAGYQGDVASQYERLVEAKNAQQMLTDDEFETLGILLDSIESNHRFVEINANEGADRILESHDFDPTSEDWKIVQRAILIFSETGKFEGYLPEGSYILNGSDIELISGGDPKRYLATEHFVVELK